MPLIYQGRLKRRTVGSPGAALRFGTKTFDGVTRSNRIDARLAWERPETLGACREFLPNDAKIYWMDIAAHADVDSLAKLADWASSLRCGHISLICLKEDAPTEVRLTLQGNGPERYDDERYEPRFGHDPDRVTVKSTHLRTPSGMSKEQKRFAASRVRTCFETLTQHIDGDHPQYPDWLRAQDISGSMGTAASDAEQLRTAPLFFGTLAEPSNVLWNDLEVKTSLLEECPVDLAVVMDPENADLARVLWTLFAGLMPQIDLIVVRCVDRQDRLMEILDQLDLFHYHPHRNNHLYGISTLHSSAPIDAETITAMLSDDGVTHALSDWDLRWSELVFDLTSMPKQDLGPMGSHYVIRSDSNRSTDRLFLNVGLEDPNEPTFRGARRQLAATFGEAIGRESAWEFVGSPTNTPLGRHYRQLNDRLTQALATVMSTPVDVPPASSTNLLEFVPFLRGPSDFEGQFMNCLKEAISNALPGFQFDRKAHVTDRYFAEFVRRIAGGYELIEIQRSYQPMGFTARFGVCSFRIPFDDLAPGVECAVPGCLVDLKTLVPERDVHWTFRSHHGLQRQLADFGTILELRVRPFFDAAAQVLKQLSPPERKALS